MEIYASNEGSVDANVSNVTASTSKNTQDNDMAIKDFFQPQLSHNLARSEVITASTARLLWKSLQCGWEWWLSRHGKVSNATFIE